MIQTSLFLAIGWLAAPERLSFFAVVCRDVVQGMFGSWYGGVGWVGVGWGGVGWGHKIGCYACKCC